MEDHNTKPKILVFAGSTRSDSFNKKLARVAAKAIDAAGGAATYIDLRDFPLPLYDGDLEKSAGLPENAKKIKALMISHAGFLIASPEYNSSISGVLKNTLDWASRPEPGEKSLVAYTGKVVALVSASPGALGGLRGLVHLRSILGNINVLLIPDQLAVSKASEAFNPQGELSDEKLQKTLASIAEKLVTLAAKIS